RSLLERYRRRGRRSRRRRRWCRQRLLENRARLIDVRGHQLKNESEKKKDSAAPPAELGEKISRLANADERIGGRARATEAGREAGALSRLRENGPDQENAIDGENDEEKIVNHCGK